MRRKLSVTATLACAAAIAGVTGGEVRAGDYPTLVALTGGRTLLIIDAETATVQRQVNVTGPGGRVVGIDVRPFDKKLYGVMADGSVVTIDPQNGSTSKVSTLSQRLPDGVRATVDFNPAVDRLRMIGSDGTNLSGDVVTGTVAEQTDISFALPNPFGGTAPSVVAGAYINNLAGARATLLYDLEVTTDALHLQIPPAGGVLNAVANPLGFQIGNVGFDIETLADLSNRAWLANNRRLYQLDLTSGLPRFEKPIVGLTTAIRDLAVLMP